MYWTKFPENCQLVPLLSFIWWILCALQSPHGYCSASAIFLLGNAHLACKRRSSIIFSMPSSTRSQQALQLLKFLVLSFHKYGSCRIKSSLSLFFFCFALISELSLPLPLTTSILLFYQVCFITYVLVSWCYVATNKTCSHKIKSDYDYILSFESNDLLQRANGTVIKAVDIGVRLTFFWRRPM